MRKKKKRKKKKKTIEEVLKTLHCLNQCNFSLLGRNTCPGENKIRETTDSIFLGKKNRVNSKLLIKMNMDNANKNLVNKVNTDIIVPDIKTALQREIMRTENHNFHDHEFMFNDHSQIIKAKNLFEVKEKFGKLMTNPTDQFRHKIKKIKIDPVKVKLESKRVDSSKRIFINATMQNILNEFSHFDKNEINNILKEKKNNLKNGF